MCRWKARGSAVLAVIASLGFGLAVIAAAPLMAQTSSGQAWPTKRVQVIVPFSPGSATDLLPRSLFEFWIDSDSKLIERLVERRRQGRSRRPHDLGAFQRAGDGAGDPEHAV